MTNIKMIILGVSVLLCGCATLGDNFSNHAMAAKIYTDLSRYYWQQGHVELARNRLNLALQHLPDYPDAVALQAQIQVSQQESQ